MSHSIQHCGILIIAAGESKRLGSPKQLLLYEGKTLINRLIDIAMGSGDFPITLVLGANAEKIQAQLTTKNLQVVINEQWQQGMAGSIVVGLTNVLEKTPLIDGIMVLVCDQPFVNADKIQSLISLQQNSGLPIAACYYANELGTPALFHKSVFTDLLALKGDIGAKKIIKQRENEVAKLHFDEGVIDIDTMDDYNALRKEKI